jgi:hypothetical protein
MSTFAKPLPYRGDNLQRSITDDEIRLIFLKKDLALARVAITTKAAEDLKEKKEKHTF